MRLLFPAPGPPVRQMASGAGAPAAGAVRGVEGDAPAEDEVEETGAAVEGEGGAPVVGKVEEEVVAGVVGHGPAEVEEVEVVRAARGGSPVAGVEDARPAPEVTLDGLV